jgi:hypothetical protein
VLNHRVNQALKGAIRHFSIAPLLLVDQRLRRAAYTIQQYKCDKPIASVTQDVASL